MGTRADFYVGRGERAEWLGSIAWDGYPSGITITTGEVERVAPGIAFKLGAEFPEGKHLFDASTEPEFRERLSEFFKHRDDVTLPDMGWPWPWDDSRTTDYAYAFDGDAVWVSSFGNSWLDPRKNNEDKEPDNAPKQVFPYMGARKNLTMGRRSGLIVVTG